MTKLSDLVLPDAVRLCAFAKLVETLDKSDRKILEDALADARWANRVLVDELGLRGFKTSRDSLTAHRNGRCLCLKD